MAKELNIFGEGVKKLRNKLNLSQPEFARRSKNGGRKGISDGYLNQIESGQILPETLTVQKIVAIADTAGVTPIEVFNLALGIEETKFEEKLLILLTELTEARKEDITEIAKMYYFKQRQKDIESQEVVLDSKKYDNKGISGEIQIRSKTESKDKKTA